MLVHDHSTGAYNVKVACYRCGRRVRLSSAWIDTEGPSFRAYYCEGCEPHELPKRIGCDRDGCTRDHRRADHPRTSAPVSAGDAREGAEAMTDPCLFSTAYLEALLWSSEPDRFDEDAWGDAIAHDSLRQWAEHDCAEFLRAAGNLLDEWDDEQAGHDFALTRNGHGTGFWDRPNLPNRDELSDLARRAGEVWVYRGDDGYLYDSRGDPASPAPVPAGAPE